MAQKMKRLEVTTAIELKPCPFCGGEAKLIKGFPSQQGKGSNIRFVQCKRCNCKTKTFQQLPFESWRDNEAAAIKAWNERVNQ